MSTITATALVENVAAKAAEAGDLESLCVALSELRALKKTVGLLDDELSTLIAPLIHGPYKEVDGIGVVEVKKRSDRKAWDHDRLTDLVVARAIDERVLDEETGEYEREATAVAKALRDCAGISYWKVTGLRKRGIDPDEFCETTPGRVAVILP